MKEKEELKAVVSEDTSEENKAETVGETDALTAPDHDSAANSTETSEAEQKPAEKKKKKSPLIQIPVLISLVIVVLTVVGYAVGYYVYSAYYLNLLEDIVWKDTKDGIDYYIEFSEDHLMKISWASYEETFSYTDIPEEGDNVIEVATPDGNIKLQYYMSGSRKLKNQKLTLTEFYSREDLYDCDEVESITSALELPTQVQLDSKLTGVWEKRFSDNYFIRLHINKDGTLKEEITYLYDVNSTFIQATNQTYTTANGYVHSTTANIVNDPQTGKPKIEYVLDQEPYEFDGNQLVFRKQQYTRVKETATPDETDK